MISKLLSLLKPGVDGNGPPAVSTAQPSVQALPPTVSGPPLNTGVFYYPPHPPQPPMTYSSASTPAGPGQYPTSPPPPPLPSHMSPGASDGSPASLAGLPPNIVALLQHAQHNQSVPAGAPYNMTPNQPSINGNAPMQQPSYQELMGYLVCIYDLYSVIY